MSSIDACQSELPIPLFNFCSKLIESVRKMALVTRLSPLEAIQRRTWVTASTSIAELEVDVSYTECWAQNGSTHVRVFATFKDRCLAKRTRNASETLLCDCILVLYVVWTVPVMLARFLYPLNCSSTCPAYAFTCFFANVCLRLSGRSKC